MKLTKKSLLGCVVACTLMASTVTVFAANTQTPAETIVPISSTRAETLVTQPYSHHAWSADTQVAQTTWTACSTACASGTHIATCVNANPWTDNSTPQTGHHREQGHGHGHGGGHGSRHGSSTYR